MPDQTHTIGCYILLCSSVNAESFAIADNELDDLLTPKEVSKSVKYDPESCFTYIIQEDGTIKLVRYVQNIQVNIPEAINGIPVTSLGENAFFNTDVADIFLSYTDIQIDEHAFDYCDATIWLPVGHPTLSTATVMMRKDPYSAEYIPDPWSGQKFKYYYNFDDDKQP